MRPIPRASRIVERVPPIHHLPQSRIGQAPWLDPSGRRLSSLLHHARAIVPRGGLQCYVPAKKDSLSPRAREMRLPFLTQCGDKSRARAMASDTECMLVKANGTWLLWPNTYTPRGFEVQKESTCQVSHVAERYQDDQMDSLAPAKLRI